MPNAKVGIEFASNDAAYRAAVKATAAFTENTFEQIYSKMGAMFAKVQQSVTQASKHASDTARKSANDSAAAYKTAAEAIAAQEKKLSDMRAKYSSDNKKMDDKLTRELVDNMKHLQDEKVKVLNAMKGDVSKEAKEELNIRKKQIEEELRLMKSVAMEKKGVLEGGAGAKAGMLGTGRNLIGGIPGADMLMGGGIAAGATAVIAGFKKVIDIGKEFESSMANLSAITGFQGKDLDNLGVAARNLAKEFGGSASDQVKAFQGVLSRLGPDIAKSPEALERMGKALGTLNAATGGELGADKAMDALTNSMLQFNISLDDPVKAAGEMEKMMNVMAASAKVGAAEIPQVAEAVVVAGSALSNANVTFEESNAAIQVIAAKSGQYGSQAGTSLRNVVGLLQKNSAEAQKLTGKLGIPFEELGQTLNKQGLAAVMEKLRGGINKLGTDAEKNAAMMQIFGTENAGVAMSLMKNTDMMQEFTKGVTGTNVANEQAKVNQATFNAQLDRFLANLEDIALTIYEKIQPALSGLMEVIGVVVDVIVFLVGWIIKLHGWMMDIYIAVIKWVIEFLGLDKIFNAVVEYIKRVIEWVKNFIANWDKIIALLKEKFRPEIDAVGKVMNWLGDLFSKIGNYIGGVFARVWEDVVLVFDKVGKAIAWVVGRIVDIYKWMFNAASAVVKWAGSFLGLENAIKAIGKWVSDLVGKISGAIDAIGSLLSSSDAANAKTGQSLITQGVQSKPEGVAAGEKAPVMVEPATEDKKYGDVSLTGDSKKPKEKKKSAEEIRKEKYDKEREALQLALDDQLHLIEKAYEEQDITEAIAKLRRLNAEKVFNDTLIKSVNISNDDKHKLTQASQLREIAIRKASYDVEKEELDKWLAEQTEKQNDALENGLIGKKDAKRAQLKLEIEYNEKLKAEAEKFGLKTLEIDKKIFQLRTTIIKDEKAGKAAAAVDEEKIADDLEKRRIDRMEKGLEKELALQAFKYKQDLEKAAGHAELIKAIEEDNQEAIAAIHQKYYEEEAKRAIEFGKEIADAVWGKGKKIDEAEKKELEESEKKFEAKKRSIRIREKDEEKANAKIATLTKEHEAQKSDIQNKYSEQREENSAKNNLKQLALQKLGLDKGLTQIIVTKAAEAGIWIATEFQKTAATESGVFARIGMVATEIWSNIKAAASSAYTAVANAIKWITTIIPFPASLALIPLAAAGVYGAYKGARALFEFADGGILNQPVFSPLTPNGSFGGSLGGEAGKEAVIPLSRYPGFVALMRGDGLIDLTPLTDGIGDLKQSIQEQVYVTAIDQNKQKLSQQINDNENSRRRI